MEPFSILLVCLTAVEVRDPLGDLNRFPSHKYAVDQAARASIRAETFRRLHSIREVHPIELSRCDSLTVSRPWQREILVAHYARARYEWSCWMVLASATNRSRETWDRADDLRMLRCMLGDEAWAAGQMPPSWLLGE